MNPDTKLNQILAIEKGVKSRATRDLTDLHKACQKAGLFYGLLKTYEPDEEEGEQLPPESQAVQLKSENVLERVRDTLTELYDVVATKDVSNLEATADVVVDEKKLLTSVPVTFLIYLEKQLDDLETFVNKMPMLTDTEAWEFDSNKNTFQSNPVKRVRTMKVPQSVVKYEATDKHPAQTELVYVDKRVGQYTTVHLSGALSAQRKQEITDNIAKLKKAVKFAREEANSRTITKMDVGEKIFNYILG